jgi:hypothetical protein
MVLNLRLLSSLAGIRSACFDHTADVPTLVYHADLIFRGKRTASRHPAEIYRDGWIQLIAGSAYSAVVEQYDWPLMAVFLVVVLSITLILQALPA